MSLFDCLEDQINELELKIIESLRYSESPDLNKAATNIILLLTELMDSQSYLNQKTLYFHKQTYKFIQELYVSRYIEGFGIEPKIFGG